VVEEEEEEAMAKSMRSKKEKRLLAIRREIVEPFYDNKDSERDSDFVCSPFWLMM
jgi:hypothetical protein